MHLQRLSDSQWAKQAPFFLPLIWVADIFMRLHHRWMVHHGTSISPRAEGFWVSRLSQSVLFSVRNTPLWVTLSEPQRPDKLILLYGHVFVFHRQWRGRFPSTGVEKKIKFERNALGSEQKRRETRVHLYTTKCQNLRPRVWLSWPLIVNTLLAFSYGRPAFIKINSRFMRSPGERLNFSSQLWFPSRWPALKWWTFSKLRLKNSVALWYTGFHILMWSLSN